VLGRLGDEAWVVHRCKDLCVGVVPNVRPRIQFDDQPVPLNRDPVDQRVFADTNRRLAAETCASIGQFRANAPDHQRANIHHAGYVGDDDLAALYEGALCLAFPSKTEGFGIPPLEAMARGCPVISSNAASLVEVGGNAVAYVDPDHGHGWRDAIIGLAGNQDLRATMAAQGRKRAALFSWKRSAQLYLDEILRLPA
jgi:glycosyltransferase involved in cell wall biosynthesis